MILVCLQEKKKNEDMIQKRRIGKNNEGNNEMDPETQLKVSRDVRWQMHA